MQDSILRKLFLGFIQIYILSYAKKEPIFGSWLIEKLQHQGYELSAGTLYPILHNLEKRGILSSENRVVNGKSRKYYNLTQKGEEVLLTAKEKIHELTAEI
jgi:DNA-binding PadR family transcriptional regulator